MAKVTQLERGKARIRAQVVWLVHLNSHLLRRVIVRIKHGLSHLKHLTESKAHNKDSKVLIVIILSTALVCR